MNPKISHIFLGISAFLAAAAIALLIIRPGEKKDTSQPKNNPPETTENIKTIPGLDDPANDPQPDTTPPDTTNIVAFSSPAELLAQIAAALEKNDIDTASKLIGQSAISPDALARLTDLSQKGKLHPVSPNGIREVGEIELNRLSRWAIELENNEGSPSRILFDIRRDEDKWIIEKVMLPDDPNIHTTTPDPLTIADTFLQAVLIQDFDTALKYVDSSLVTDTKIAALCILFEEGQYRMKSSKPLRAMFTRPDTVGYIANVETSDGATSAQFALNLRLNENPSSWLVSEINLDKLLADYAERFADGDIYYSPLVKNPTGGETLALYFGFDEDSMSPRTKRQIEIVAAILKNDPSKHITLSGHADALGTKQYNDTLSSNRAAVVRDFLIASGVPDTQVSTIAKGASQPRRPNVTETGEDDPQGRRANRRTEIYLDF
jgi:OmpA-OmpF porin, OOP family